MDDDQQFCLRWNNHQSTLVAVFDTLLENGTLVDCTLAAEGKYLNAHKVVLSACSPYFESLLSRHFDKHPILILKDVKFQELKAMMDYMYRGEVNISQDQLGALLKAAESLQIKGLSDNRKGEADKKTASVPPQPPKSPQPTSALPKVQGLTIEQRSRDDSREGSQSPGPRKKKRLRRKSDDLDNHDASNSSETHSLTSQNIPSSLPAVSKLNADVPESVETKSEILSRHKPSDDVQVPIIREKLEAHSELMIEPKSEYVDEMNEDSIEDLTLDEDDLSNMEQMDDGAGPSHGNAGEGSSQGFGGWHMNQSQDEVFLAAQEAVGAHRDSQGAKQLGQTKPHIKILKVDDLKSDDIVERIKKELSSHITFGKSESKSQTEEKAVTLMKAKTNTVRKRKIPAADVEILQTQVANKLTAKTTNVSLNESRSVFARPRKLVTIERMKRFLNMKPEDLPKTKKKYKCELDAKEWKKPVDTLRCSNCGILYETAKHAEHMASCKGKKVRTKFGCTQCSYTDYSIRELENHIRNTHPKKTM